ncbi:MAG TPA: porin family protein [Chryseolinea sp.]|nr:porin family protein [Chryseolinea sp.]
MKTFYFALGLLLFLNVSAFSQLLVGPEVGVNYSWTSFRDKDLKDIYKMSPAVGFHVGGHIAFKVRNRFFLHTSLLYSTKGRTLNGKLDGTLKNSARYNFIDMPINYTVDFRGRIGKGKEFKYFLGIGPNISYWLGGKGKLYNSELEENNLGELSYKIDFSKSEDGEQMSDEMRVERPNRLQLGLNLMAGIVFEPWHKQRFMFSVRYELGHTYLAKSDGAFVDTYFYDPLQSRNQGFRISLAYLVDLKTEERKKGKSTLDKKKLNKR